MGLPMGNSSLRACSLLVFILPTDDRDHDGIPDKPEHQLSRTFSEYVAILSATTQSERLQAFKENQERYRLRSTIFHGGKPSNPVTIEQYAELLQLTKKVFWKVNNLYESKALNTYEDLDAHLKKQLFANGV